MGNQTLCLCGSKLVEDKEEFCGELIDCLVCQNCGQMFLEPEQTERVLQAQKERKNETKS